MKAKAFLKTLWCAGVVLNRGWWRKPARAFWKKIQDEAYPPPAPLPTQPPQLPQKTAAALFPQEMGLELHHIIGQDGNVSVIELAILAKAAKMLQPAEIFEIGTFDGRTTFNLAVNAPQARVYTLDLPPTQADQTALSVESIERKYIEKPESGMCFRGTKQAEKIEQLWGDSATFDFTPYEGRCDLIFVDGSHAYEYVLNDARIAQRLLSRRGGIIFFHDYGTRWWAGVTRALEELQKTNPFYHDLTWIEGTSLAMVRKLAA
jgi:predicted O-methyltransferase YrrM